MPHPPELVLKSFAEAVVSVFRDVAALPATHASTSVHPARQCENDVWGVLDFADKARGAAALCLPMALARKICLNITGLPETAMDARTLSDCAGELVNQILGVTKNLLLNTPFVFDLRTPRPVADGAQAFAGLENVPCIRMGFRVEGQEISLLFCMVSAEGIPVDLPAEPATASPPVTPAPAEPSSTPEVPSPAPVASSPATPVTEEDLVVEEGMREIVDGFVTESEEIMEKLDRDLVALDETPDNKDVVSEVFRAFHTLKGNSRALGFGLMETMVHRTEDVIRKVRDGETGVTPGMIDVILEAVDLIKVLLHDVKDGKKRDRNLEPMIAKLRAVLEGTPAAPAVEKLVIEDDLKEIVETFLVETDEIIAGMDQDLVALEERPGDAELINKIFRAFHTLKGNSRALGFGKLETLVHRTEDIIRKARDGALTMRPETMDVVLRSVDMVKGLVRDIKNRIVSSVDLGEIIAQLSLALEEKYDELKARKEAVQPAAQAPAPAGDRAAAAKGPAATIRVDLAKLDNLINVAGELVLNKNQMLNLLQQVEAGLSQDDFAESLTEIYARLSVMVSDLQSNVLSTRMQPIGKVFSKYPRVVRDLSRELGKEMDLVLSGGETELDNTIIEEIGDPLIHLVRNSCDHGVEKPEERVAKGKNGKGTIELKAYQEGSFVVIEIRDDGKGMDPEVLKRKAVSKGLITEERARSMAKEEALGLIFAAGFSTVEKVTAISGRGVGMDVVRNSIAKLNGIIELDSEKDRGSVVKIRLPLTLATMTGLEVETGAERYLIPQEAIVEIVRVPASELHATVRDGRFLFRKQYWNPLIDCADVVGLRRNGHGTNGQSYIVVLGKAEKRMGVLVDNVLQQHEVVIKPLGAYVNSFAPPQVMGATIMGDGGVGLILNPNHLIDAGAVSTD